MLNPRYATKNKGSECRCSLCVSDKKLAISVRFDCFLVFYLISQPPNMGDFAWGFFPFLSHLQRFSFMLPLFPWRSLSAAYSPCLDEDIQVQAGSCRAVLNPSSLLLPSAMLLCWQTTPKGGPSVGIFHWVCAGSLQWEESKFRASRFCRCCSNVDHLWGLQCMLESCQLCCDNIIACSAAEAFVLLEWILGFCNKNALSSTQRPENLGSAAFKGTKIAVSLYLGK